MSIGKHVVVMMGGRRGEGARKKKKANTDVVNVPPPPLDFGIPLFIPPHGRLIPTNDSLGGGSVLLRRRTHTSTSLDLGSSPSQIEYESQSRFYAGLSIGVSGAGWTGLDWTG